MIHKKLLYIFFATPIFLFSQTKQKKIPEIERLLDSAYIKTTEFNLQACISFAQEALKISKKENYSRGIAIGNFRIGQSLAELNNFQYGLKYLDKAQKENQDLKDPSLNFEIRRVRSRIYGNLKLLPNAVKESRKALEIIPELEKTEPEKKLIKALVYENLALIYESMEKSDSSYYYLNESRAILEKLDTKKYLPHIINNFTELGEYYTSASKPDEAQFFLLKAIHLAKANEYPYLSFTFKSYGNLMLYRKENDSAIIYYKKALQISEKTKLKSEIPSIYQKIADAYHLLGDRASEEKYRFKSLELQNNLKSEMLAASNLAINSILSDQKEEFVKKDTQTTFIIAVMSGILILLLIGLWLLYRRKVKKVKHLKTISSQKENSLILQKEEITQRYEEDTRKLEQKVNESFDEVLALAKSNSPEFFTRFQEVYPEVIHTLLEKDCKLRVSELTLSAYFFLGFTTKDIALYTFKSINTIRNRRQNLRTKLQIPADEDLELWFKNLAKKY